MGVHAGQLALKSDLRLVQEYRRSLLPCLEQARRPTLDHHVYRSSGLGVWVLISENWYKIFLIIIITNLTLPAEGLFINTCRPGLGPSAQSLIHVPEVLILVQSQANVRQGAFTSFVIPEFGIHQNTIMIEEYVPFHSLDPFRQPRQRSWVRATPPLCRST